MNGSIGNEKLIDELANLLNETAGTDMTKYDTVLIWCRAFSVLFGSADLKAQ